ncbi:hypothetical protein DICPUDRAFT_159123 [Dictyostelium purpureum]|uniref:Uncharacterized protein n=1 Tax=Dictyostelium purpureum TaxID=5786 RepID=F1A3C3_DICPU|nr:uncharacterized protein DICPUDRAFT_159123 [Dictyostelium purpureum]EGC29308.1 hypothetical protein DICPUDRAFT_159123 [Dictyostelium purpureum]|eukprot:XP_003294166.1 hypothetical protein DICPUDRAFT_159123 [Dictyostelium purpureum]
MMIQAEQLRKLDRNKIKSTKGYIKELESVSYSPRSSGSQSASSASAIRENDQVLKVKFISLAKQLFKKKRRRENF